MHKKKKSICIISFSPIHRDARVLRQIKYLSPFYKLTVIGYGQPHPNWVNRANIRWISVDWKQQSMNGKEEGGVPLLAKRLTTFLRPSMRPMTVAEYLMMFLGRVHPILYDAWFWGKRQHSKALQFAIRSRCDAFLANDWDALPVAAEAARENDVKLVFDAHEYAPLELENRRYWRVLFQPAIIHFLKKYVSRISASLTVAPLISERYKQEYGLEPMVILNAPARATLPDRELDHDQIRLIHHGGAISDRRLERMIKALTFCDHRFSLHFMLIKNDLKYLNQLKRLAKEMAPGRVLFHEPVPPEEIVQRISEFDMGIYLLEPNNYNNRVALPNKFFDFVAAGLAVCVGPSPSMARMVNEYGFGCVAPSFEPSDVADMLNGLRKDQLLTMRAASKQAAERINAEAEMSKLVELFVSIFD
jgi:hypothetical protein